jgi:hypothetical protein
VQLFAENKAREDGYNEPQKSEDRHRSFKSGQSPPTFLGWIHFFSESFVALAAGFGSFAGSAVGKPMPLCLFLPLACFFFGKGHLSCSSQAGEILQQTQWKLLRLPNVFS